METQLLRKQNLLHKHNRIISCMKCQPDKICEGQEKENLETGTRQEGNRT